MSPVVAVALFGAFYTTLAWLAGYHGAAVVFFLSALVLMLGAAMVDERERPPTD